MRTIDLRKKNIRRILVMKWGAMGDLVISTAMFDGVRRAFPGAEIDLHVLPPFAPLFLHDPTFTEICTIDVRRGKGGLRAVREWLGYLRRRKYDVVFDLQSNDRSRLLMSLWLLSGGAPRWRVGNHPRFPYNIARQKTAVLPHAFDMQCATLAAAGIETIAERPVLYAGEENRIRAAELMAANGLNQGDFAIFFPGSQAAGSLKRWGVERYTALAVRLQEVGMKKVALVGGPDDAEECKKIATLCPPEMLVNLCGQTRILDIVPLCEAARVIVSNDTGTAHIASATATPMLVICGPTDPRRVKPVGPQVAALQVEGPCINCYRKDCNYTPAHLCMTSISVDMVLAKLRSMPNALAEV